MDKFEKCLICLEDCNIYLKLKCCNCRNITHEKCFKDYINNNNKVIKCLICKEIYDYDIFYISSSPLFNSIFKSIFYAFFIVLQNMYFMFDEMFFGKNLTILRTSSVFIFHIFLTIILIMPYMTIFYINYAIFICRKPYKIIQK